MTKPLNRYKSDYKERKKEKAINAAMDSITVGIKMDFDAYTNIKNYLSQMFEVGYFYGSKPKKDIRRVGQIKHGQIVQVYEDAEHASRTHGIQSNTIRRNIRERRLCKGKKKFIYID